MTRSFDGSPPFADGARAALADPQLRANLARATTTIRAKRDRVVGELDTWEDLRLAGEAVKSSALGHLDELLVELEANVTAAGGTVHWARDAAEANRIVVDLVAATGESGVVKVKSMTTGEIGLNQALESAGIRAYETDLAELIVQLGDDLPSHIVVPAIHRNRDEIRTTFVDRMGDWGRAAPEDLRSTPADLAGTARLHLRERFLAARTGVSGANFLVADTGAVAVVESEGNGRMCLTLPDTLITVAGIDKVVASWEDLDVLLQVLPRSATGERMNPYTSVWTGVVPGDGPSAFHLVLLDNGRSSALADEVGRQALRCIRCAACLNVCPVYERVGGHAYGSIYPGPIGAVLTPQLDHVATDEVARSLPYASTLCGACFDACPVRIDIPRLLVHLRGEVVDAARGLLPASQEQLTMAGAAWALGRPSRIDRLTRLGAVAAKLVGGRRLRLPGFASGWSATRSTPLPQGPSFAEWWRATHPSGTTGGGDTSAATLASRSGRGRGRGSGSPSGSGSSSGPGSRSWSSLARSAGSSLARSGRSSVRSAWASLAWSAGSSAGRGRHGRGARGVRAPWARRAGRTTSPVPAAAGLTPEPAPQQVPLGPTRSSRARPDRGGAGTTGTPAPEPAVPIPGAARDEILARIRRALGDDRSDTPIPRAYRRPLPGRPDPVTLFAERVDDYRATIHRTDEAGLAGTIAAALSDRGSTSVVVPADLDAGWTAGLDVPVHRDPGPPTGPLAVAELDAVDTVITACAVAVAETGTVVLDGGAGQGRRALTLVPDHHVVVVRQAQIVADVPAAISRLRADAPQTWISGPSATSDIELDRVEGVHGPRRLDVILILRPPPRVPGIRGHEPAPSAVDRPQT